MLPAPDELVARAEALQVLEDAYDDLPGNSLVVLRLRQMGLRWQETACLVRGWEPDVSVRTLERRFRRAEQGLRDRMQRATLTIRC